MADFKRPTAAQFVTALLSTSQRYHDGLMSYATFKTHQRSLWGQIEASPRLASRVRTALRAALAEQPLRDGIMREVERLQGGAR